MCEFKFDVIDLFEVGFKYPKKFTYVLGAVICIIMAETIDRMEDFGRWAKNLDKD